MNGEDPASLPLGVGKSSPRPAPKPSVGRIVHYVSYGSADGTHKSGHKAAMITDVRADGTVALTVFNCKGMFFNEDVRQDEEAQAPGTWHWPERED